ncbi:rod shape-determining protein MreC [Sphingobium sufflavum]|uniref:rod shape-determining protein MreC n=1 Tax=Sphingobium sufflavum TaxID=1129547 RepID=UPI001F183645|nr:rod shape-determining protein MreC [Sphingobium sufflavum]MCE7796037.1 rod shape-determining protein MreC [Sphingobium sufflavum]
MAPPRKRRPGYDRKAQYGLFASYVIAITGALAALLLVVVSAADPAGFAVLRAGVAEVTRPVSGTLRSMVLTIGNLDEIVGSYINAGTQNITLRRQVETTRTKLIEADAIRQENIRLKSLLHLADEEGDVVASGRLVSSSSSSSRRIARLDVGSRSGVQTGMPVRAAEGLVGRVLWAGLNTADILLLVDSENVVPVRRAKDNIPGISRGLDDGTVEIRALNAERNPFRPGDIFVTSGIGGIYRPNIPVAVVARVVGERAIAIPLANPGRVELAIVQRTFQSAEARAPDAATDAAGHGGTGASTGGAGTATGNAATQPPAGAPAE